MSSATLSTSEQLCSLVNSLCEQVSGGPGDRPGHPATAFATTLMLGAVGMISGMISAVQASRLDPIEALRYE